VGYGLIRLKAYAKAARWMGDWQQRQDAEPWMLLNAALAHRYRRQSLLARQASMRALQRPEDATTILHIVWLTVEDILCSASFETGSNTWPLVKSAELSTYYGFLRLLVEALGEVQRPGPEERRTRFSTARYLLAQARALMPRYEKDRVLSDAYYRAVQLIARADGGLAARLWSLNALPLFWRWRWKR
jgi:hypothetical protein